MLHALPEPGDHTEVAQVLCGLREPGDHTAAEQHNGFANLIAKAFTERFRSKGETTLDTEVKQARDRAEAAFKKKEQQLQEGQQAMAEYEAARTFRLPSLPTAST